MGEAHPPGPSLPRTIEEATRRYIANYEKNFSGPHVELDRLRKMTKALIYNLRKIAPRFYEEKLPTFVNQACSTLLTFETSKREDAIKFHQCHRAFMLILEDFSKTQPAGEVNFYNERMRIEERKKLIDRQAELEAEIDKLEATEFDYDEIGDDDDPESLYAQLVRKLDFLKAEMKRINIQIAYIDGIEIEEKPHFELKVLPRSLLSRLSTEQLSNLEQQMFEVVKANNNKRTAMFVDKTLIDSMIEKLNIDPTQFKKEELRHISKDALDAYKEYFRNIDAGNREEYYNELCKRPSLLPKEGTILRDPNDVPEDVKIKLEQNTQQCKRQMEEVFEEYSKRPCADDAHGDAVSDDDEEEERSRILETVRRKGIKFERVKEEPRDDCDLNELMSGDEIEVDEDVARTLVANNDASYSKMPTHLIESDAENEVVEEEQQHDNDHGSQVKMETNGYTNGDGGQTTHEDANADDDDDEIECLGTIEPSDKIQKVDLD